MTRNYITTTFNPLWPTALTVLPQTVNGSSVIARSKEGTSFDALKGLRTAAASTAVQQYLRSLNGTAHKTASFGDRSLLPTEVSFHGIATLLAFQYESDELPAGVAGWGRGIVGQTVLVLFKWHCASGQFPGKLLPSTPASPQILVPYVYP